MKKLLFVALAVIKICETGNGMMSLQKYNFMGASDLRAITFEINTPNIKMLPNRFFQLKESIVEKQRIFMTEHQESLAARCKFILAMLIAHSNEMAYPLFDLSEAARLLLEAAEGGDTDAQEVVLASTKKKSMTETTSLKRDAILDCIKRRITSSVVIKENFLRQYILKGVIDRLASIAACDDSCDVGTVIPSDAENLNDSVLAKNRNRFQMLIGSVWPLLAEADRSWVSGYINGLDRNFQDLQIKKFGVPVYESINLGASEFIPEELFNTTGGLPEILATTPDIAFSSFKDSRLKDFETVVNFIAAVKLVVEKNVSTLSDTINSLLKFLNKWDDFAVESYLQSADSTSKAMAKEYIGNIKRIIKEL